jgi:hypothetical protein
MTITIGTTPTIIFNNFQVVRVGEIKEAVLTIKQGGMYSRSVMIKRDLTTAEVTDTEIAWTLTQEETLGLDPKAQASVCMNFLTNTGLRGTSKVVNCYIDDNPLKEVMS